MTELIGFLASGLVVISLTSASMYRLRVIGVFGALSFIAYGVLSSTWPIVALNIATLTLHVVHLRRLATDRAHCRGAEVSVSAAEPVGVEA